MSDTWDGWPEDEPGDSDTADLDDPIGGFDDPPGFDSDPAAAFDPLDEAAAEGEAGEEPPGGQRPPAPIGYGDEPLDTPEPVDAGAGDEGFGAAEPDAAPGADAEFGSAESAGAGNPAEAADAPVGADPDLDPYGEDPAGVGSVFPEPLELGAPPEPVDGFPWADAALLGGEEVAPLPDPAVETAGSPPPGDLYAYAAEDLPPGEPGWTALMTSPDPATSTLARFWVPGA
jgi:hypothetical protein